MVTSTGNNSSTPFNSQRIVNRESYIQEEDSSDIEENPLVEVEEELTERIDNTMRRHCLYSCISFTAGVGFTILGEWANNGPVPYAIGSIFYTLGCFNLIWGGIKSNSFKK